MVIGAALAAASAVTALFWIGGTPRVRTDEKAKAASGRNSSLMRVGFVTGLAMAEIYLGSERSLKDAFRNFPPIIRTFARLQFFRK